MDQVYEAEIARCRSLMPRTDYCVLVESRWLRRDQTSSGLTASRQLLERELAQDPERINLKIELTRVYRLAGLEALWNSLSASLSPGELALAGDSTDLWWRY